MSYEPCLCGDTHCGSCGPAQGCYRCPSCGLWSDDENEAGGMGCLHPDACSESANAMYESMARDEEDTDRMIQESHGHAYDSKLRCGYFVCWLSGSPRRVNES